MSCFIRYFIILPPIYYVKANNFYFSLNFAPPVGEKDEENLRQKTPPLRAEFFEITLP